MVGDDLWTDVLVAQRLGLRGVFVLSGKHGARGARPGPPTPVAAAASRTSSRRSMAEVVAALD